MCICTPDLVERVVALVRQTGVLLTQRPDPQAIQAKSATDYVTNVDLAVEDTLREALAELAPQVQFMGEEEGHSDLDPARPFWILDPVDGTTNFIHNYGHSAISLALAEGGQVVFGVVYNPYRQECFTAVRGQGAQCNGRPIQVSTAPHLSDSLVAVGTVPGHRELGQQAFAQMWAVYNACQDIRRSGSASLDLCDVACGRVDGYLELYLQPWDYAAGSLILAEAGGCATGLDGAPLCLTKGGPLLSSNGRIHTALLELLERSN